MKRNSGLIGKKRLTELSATSGIFDSFDQFNSRKLNTWPLVTSYTFTSPASAISVNEGSTVTFQITTANVSDGTTLYYDFASGGLGSGDWTDGTRLGSFTVNSNLGSFSKTFTLTGRTSSLTFNGVIRTTGFTGSIVATCPNITIRATSWTLTPNVSSVNEGGSVIFTLGRTNVDGSHTMNVNLSGTNITNSDFTAGSTGQNVTSNGASNTVNFDISNDTTTEGSESFTGSLRIGSVSGTLVATSTSVTINDTSVTITASVSPTTTSVNEGSSVTFNVSTTGFPSGTLYWTLNAISGTINTSDFSGGAISGSFTISGSAGSVALTLSNDLTTEGTEQFQFQVRTGSTSGSIIGTSATVTINDTSTGPAGVTWSGGTILTPGNGFRYHVFTGPGNFIGSGPGSTTMDFLLIGGGGGGGGSGPPQPARQGGGGGSGEVQVNTSISIPSPNNYPIIIGAGGPAGGLSTRGGTGGASTFFGCTAEGGGGGGAGGSPVSPGTPAFGGASGGGAGHAPGTGGVNNFFPGFNGGNGAPPTLSGGAGGGGGQDQTPITPSTTRQCIASPGFPGRWGGNGGNGKLVPLFPLPIVAPAIPSNPTLPRFTVNPGSSDNKWGGGGGGANQVAGTPENHGGLGQSHGGDARLPPIAQAGVPGVTNTGGGGGGGPPGGNGGPGILVIRYPV